MPKCDFNKVAKFLNFDMGVHSMHIFRTAFLKNTSGRLLLEVQEVLGVRTYSIIYTIITFYTKAWLWKGGIETF